MIRVEAVTTEKARMQFIRLPWKIYQDDPYWVPPIIKSQIRAINPGSGSFFKHATGAFFLAFHEAEVVGRIAAFRNETHLEAHQDGVGFFGFFECINDRVAAHALLEAAEAWLFSQGLRVSRGPANFTIYDEAGIPIEGRDMQPAVGMAHAPAYYRDLIESAGYEAARDLYGFTLTLETFNEKVLELARIFERRDPGRIKVRPLNPKDLAGEAKVFSTVFTDAWKSTWSSLPMSEEDFVAASEELKLFIDPNLCIIGEVEGEPAGIMLAIPDPWIVLKNANGRIGPITLLRLLTARRFVPQYRVILMGIREQYRRSLVSQLMLKRFHEVWTQKRQMQSLEISWVSDDNVQLIKLVEKLGARKQRTYRLYDKKLPSARDVV